MLKNHNLAKNISSASWVSFAEMLSYKAKWYGKDLIKVDTFFPSSQLCSHCGYKHTKVKDLKIRNWECPHCRNINDRDVNAAINILNEGVRLTSL